MQSCKYHPYKCNLKIKEKVKKRLYFFLKKRTKPIIKIGFVILLSSEILRLTCMNTL